MLLRSRANNKQLFFLNRHKNTGNSTYFCLNFFALPCMPVLNPLNVTVAKQVRSDCQSETGAVAHTAPFSFRQHSLTAGLFLLFLLSAVCLTAQNKRADSLQKLLAQHPQMDTFRVNRINELAMEWTLPEAQRKARAAEALRLSHQLRYPYGKADALRALGSIKYEHNQPKQARILLQRSLKYALEGGDHKQQSTIAMFLGYATEGNQQQQYFQQSLQLAKKAKDQRLQAEVLYRLGWFSKGKERQKYFQQAVEAAQSADAPALVLTIHNENARTYYFDGDFPAAIQSSMQALKQVEKVPKADRDSLKIELLQVLSWTYTQLKDYDRALTYLKEIRQLGLGIDSVKRSGSIFSQLGDTYREQGNYDKAIEAYEQGLKFAPHLKGTNWLIAMEANSAVCYQQKGLHQKAFLHARRALELINVQENKFLKALTYRAMGQSHLQSGALDSALYYGHESFRSALDFKDKPSLRDAGLLLARTYARKKDYEKAYDFQQKYTAYKDSLNNETVTRKATANQFTLQLQQQQEEARLQRIQLFSSLAVLALLIGLAVLLFFNNRQKQKANAQLQAQKTEIQTQRDQIEHTLTELKATQTQLIQKEKMAGLGELTAGIAHEIQNPLNFVNNFSELSVDLARELKEEMDKVSLPEKEKEYILELLEDLSQNQEKINHHGRRAAGIVKGMLEHSRNSTGERELTDVNALAEEYLRLAYHGLKAKDRAFGAEYVLITDKALPKIHVVPQEIGRVVLNLLNNAFYAVNQRAKREEPGYRPKVKVTTKAVRNGIELEVSDNGPGMTQEIKAKIFQPFFTTKPTGEGTGLGLSLSYDIITKGHGGTLEAQSEPGEGTGMRITLPV